MEENKNTVEAYKDLLSAQKEIGVILKEKDNPYFKSKYADINVMLAEVKPKLNAHNWVLLQALTTVDGKLGLRTILVHTNGTKFEDFCPLPETVKAQEAGSAITYFRRYAIQSLLALEADDDDGNVASGKTAAPVAKTFTPAPAAPAPAKGRGRPKKEVGEKPAYPENDSDEIPFETDEEKATRLAKEEAKKNPPAKPAKPADDDLDFIG